MIELWLNGTRMVLDGRTVITQTRQNNDLYKGIASRQISYTNQFAIPAEPNLNFFQELGLVGNTSIKPYRIITARLVVDGIELYNNGRCIIKKTSDMVCTGQIIFDGGVLDELKKRQMSDIDPSLLLPNGTDTLDFDSTFDYFKIIENPNDYALLFAYKASAQSDYLVPYWKEKDLIVALLEDLGVQYTADFLESETIAEKAISPRTGGVLTQVVTSPAGGSNNIWDETDLPINDEIIPASGSGDDYFTRLQVTYNVTWNAGGNGLRIILETSSGKVYYDSGIINPPPGTPPLNNNSTTFIFDVPRSVDLRAKITATLAPNIDIQLTTIAIRAVRRFSIAQLLPASSQADFLREVLFRYNLNIYEIDGALVFKKLADILNDRANAQDWSDIFQNVIEENYETDFGKKNTAQYTNDKEEGRDHLFELDNENLPSLKSVFNSQYKYAEDENAEYVELDESAFVLDVIKWIDQDVSLNKQTKSQETWANLEFGNINQQLSYTYRQSNSVVLIDATNDQLKVCDFNGSTWDEHGATTISGIGFAAICSLSRNRIAFIDETNDNLRVYEFNGLSWTQKGLGLNIGSVTNPAICALNSNRIAFIDATNDDLRVYEFDGTNWAQIGNELNISGVLTPSITALTESRIAFIDSGNSDLRTYEFDGTDWAQVGNELNIATMGNPDISAMSSSRIAFIDALNKDLRAYDFDGTNWAQVGSDLFFATLGTPTVSAMNTTQVAFIDGTNDELRVYSFNGSTWSIVGTGLSVAGATAYSLATLAPQEKIPVLSEPTDAQMQTIIDSEYEELRQTLERYKEVKIRARFTPIQFRDIRLDRLVYIRQLGAYFYINKVADYRDGFANAYLLQLPTSFT